MFNYSNKQGIIRKSFYHELRNITTKSAQANNHEFNSESRTQDDDQMLGGGEPHILPISRLNTTTRRLILRSLNNFQIAE